MTTSFQNHRVSIALLLSDQLPYDRAAMTGVLEAAASQDLPGTEIIVIDGRGPAARRDFIPAAADPARFIHLPGKYANRAAMYNAALQAAHGDFFLALYNDQSPVTLRRSAAQTMLMAAIRMEGSGTAAAGGAGLPVGMVYADYERIDAAGQRKDVHLLDWHLGRLRDTTDFGQAILYRTDLLRELGGWNEASQAAA